ncbi:MAG: hypothetical protein JW395_3417 [Nitrospira sp.]|nr:hypothetical protein [Nitrospira sp.]
MFFAPRVWLRFLPGLAACLGVLRQGRDDVGPESRDIVVLGLTCDRAQQARPQGRGQHLRSAPGMDLAISKVTQPAEGDGMQVNHLRHAGVLGLPGHAGDDVPVGFANYRLRTARIGCIASGRDVP